MIRPGRRCVNINLRRHRRCVKNSDTSVAGTNIVIRLLENNGLNTGYIADRNHAIERIR